MKYILTAGGTGGHIYPALAILEEIKKDKNNKYLYIGTTNRMEADLIPSMGIPYEGLTIYGLSKSDMIRNIKNIKYIDDVNVSDIRVTSFDRVFVKRKGNWERIKESFNSKEDYTNFVRYCILKKIITGDDAGNVLPQSYASRAEMATMIVRLKKVKRDSLK